MSEPCHRSRGDVGDVGDCGVRPPVAGLTGVVVPAPSVVLGERFRTLHGCERLITSDLALPVMTRRITETARSVVRTALAVLVVLDQEGTPESIVREGPDDDPALGTLLDDAASWKEMLAHLGATGLACLSSELQASGRTCARLLVAGPEAGAFTADDRAVFDALTLSAGTSIEHATLFERANSGVRWLHASGEIARAMLADADIDAFTEIVARAVEAASADHGLLITPTQDGRLTVLAGYGLTRGHIGATYDPDQSELTRSIVNGKTLRAPDISDLVTRPGGPAGVEDVDDAGPMMLAPLLDALGTRGSVLLMRAKDAPVFTDSDLERFAGYAAQVALAMQFAEARVDSERLLRVEASADAARELSDIVMQRLFAVGIGLDTLCANLAGTAHHDKLERHIVDLDRTIDEIRTRVFVSDEHTRRESVRFPRILLPIEPAAERRGAARRGRRRSDWRNGSGEVRGTEPDAGWDGQERRH